MGIKNQTIAGLKWSFVETTSNQVLHFAIGIVLARLLSPAEFGVIGIITVFTSLAQLVVDSGFSKALIRKQHCSEEDWNTMLYANLILGVLMCGSLVLVAPLVQEFYKVPDIAKLLRMMSVILVINGFGLVEQTQLARRVDFKSLTKISLISSVVSGAVGIVLALIGFSYWSLLWKSIVQNLSRVVLLYAHSKWRPKLIFSFDSLKEMFGFGSRMLIAQFVSRGYTNLYYFLIGKYFSMSELGLYTRAEQFKNLPTDSLMNTIQRVTYPILAQLEDKPEIQFEAYRKLLRTSLYITLTCIVALVFMSEEIITLLLGEKWIKAIPYLQILSLSTVTLPLRHINMNIIMVKNEPAMYLRIQMITKLLFIPLIYLGVIHGIYSLLYIVVLISILEYVIITVASVRITKYPIILQLRDVFPLLLYGMVIAFIQFLTGLIGIHNQIISLIAKTMVLFISVVTIGRLFRMPEYNEIRKTLISQLSNAGLRFGRIKR